MTTHKWDSLAGRCLRCRLTYSTVAYDSRLAECHPEVVVGLRPRPRGDGVTAYTHGGIVVERFDGSQFTIPPDDGNAA